MRKRFSVDGTEDNYSYWLNCVDTRCCFFPDSNGNCGNPFLLAQSVNTKHTRYWHRTEMAVGMQTLSFATSRLCCASS